MKPLSDSLMDLVTRMKRVEDSAATTREKNRTALQERRQKLENDFDRSGKELDAAIGKARGQMRERWSQTRSSIDEQMTAMRTDFQKRKQELDTKHAQQAAQDAEQDAAAAIVLAEYCLDAAEWATIEAGLTRAEADALTNKG